MTPPPSTPITQLLDAVGRGDESAHEQLWLLIYDELHRIAQSQMAAEREARTLQPTALVHEAYLRLFAGRDVQWANRRHFFAAAARAMRCIRIDDARRRSRLKRGGGQRPLSLDEASVAHAQKGRGSPASVAHPQRAWGPPVFEQDPAEVLAIDEALKKLERTAPGKAELVELRYFAGLSEDEIGDALGLSPKTVEEEWRLARAWLHRELS